MTMKVSLRDGTEGIPVVDMDAELFEDIPGDLYVSYPQLNLQKYCDKVNSLISK